MSGFGIPSAFSSSGLAGDPVYFDTETDSIPGATKTVLEINVVSVTFTLTQILTSGQISGVFRILLNDELIGTTRVRPGKPDGFFSWYPTRQVTNGDIIKVTFEQRNNTQACKISAHLQATSET